MRVVVFGASGVQGQAQVSELVRAGHHPVAVSRKAEPLTVDGHTVETAAADFTDRASVAEALKGAEIVFLNLPSTSFQKSDVVLAAGRLVGEEIKKQSPPIRLTVFNTSMPVPDVPQGIRAQDDRRTIRDNLRAQGLAVVSIQPVCYLDNLLEGWARPPIVERSTLVYCHKPSLRASWISHIDLAKLMISAMQRPDDALVGRNIPVGGPETVRLTELAEKLARGWGRPLRCENQTVADFCQAMGDAMRKRSSIDVDRIISQMYKAYTWYNEEPSEPFVVDMDAVLKELPLDTPLLTIEEWARLKPLPPVASTQ
ncbi:NAD(P)-binding domain protein [Niveomyces insectorum RCEF 264]|uniref:NAD(P)-binding domain protein n=1 Tax=Niveomyces insectorum RCEF 264 TaxID=1081102 RepID=A0A167SKU4_9HYPO|nr:NAD(P)-binding domain protein [Niveomyces insectorum RCEF 264]